MSLSHRTASDIKENTRLDSETEDELSAPSKLFRVVRGNSAAKQAGPTGHEPTPYENLRHLAELIPDPSTPPRRASSVEATTSCGNAVGALSVKSRTPDVHRPLHAFLTTRNNPATPHVIRALQQRRATPGRDRRKSRHMRRETPRDALRHLSKILALISQPTPLPSQLVQNEPSLIGSNSTEDGLQQQRPNLSIAIEDQADEDDSFHLAPPRLSMSLEAGEATRGSIKIGRRAPDDLPPGKICRGSFGTVRGSDRFDDLSALGLTDPSQRPLEDGELQSAPDADHEGLEIAGIGGETENLRHVMYKSCHYSEGHCTGVQQVRELEGGVHSPFILNIPDFQSGRSLAEATHLYEQQLGGLDEELEQNVLSVRSTNPTTKNKPERRAARPMKKSSDGYSGPKLPANITKKIASTFARSLGSKSTIVDNETLKAITEATDKYFKQLSNDLGTFANHAGRKKIDESDVIAIMRR